MYGLTLLVAILAAIGLTGRRWVAKGGDWDLVTRVAVWGVAFGVIGARAYHDVTSWNEVPTPKWQGDLRGVEGRPRRLGRHPPRRACGRGDRPARRREHSALHGCRRARPPACAGHRPDRQLVEPGALRQADLPSLGAEDRPRPPAGRPEVPRVHDLPSHVSLRADLGRGRRPAAAVDRPPVPAQSAEPVRALRRLVLLRPLLRGTVADRPRPPHRGSPPERLGEHHRVRLCRRVFRAGTSGGRGAATSRSTASRRNRRTRWRSPRAASGSGDTLRDDAGGRRASSSWTWTRSKGRSTSCSRSSFARSCRCARSISRTSSSRSSSISPSGASSTSTPAASS